MSPSEGPQIRRSLGELITELAALEPEGLTQMKKAGRLGISQARVSILERVRKKGTEELVALIMEGNLPAEALKFLPLDEPEVEKDWVARMRGASPEERSALVKEVKDLRTGISPPSLKELVARVTKEVRYQGAGPDDHLVGVVSGIGHVLGYYSFDAAMDETGQLQLAACEKLCKGRKAGQYHWIRNFFGSATRGRID